MRDIVIVPCYERPEYTYLCLKYLFQARGIQDKQVWLGQDCHIGNHRDIYKQMIPVADYGVKLFGGHFYYGNCPAHNTYGNSYNLVQCLDSAYQAGAERIFLVEDDIMVAPDVFEWHESVLEEPNVFVSCATALNKSAHFQINGPQVMDETLHDPSAYLKVCGPYSSHCTAFKRDALGMILKHFNHYSSERWTPGFEQDLVAQNFFKMHSNQKFFKPIFSAWPYVPRAYNVGWRSYHINTGVQFQGTLEEKVAALEAAIHDPARLHEMSAGNQAVTALPAKWPERTAIAVRNVQRFR